MSWDLAEPVADDGTDKSPMQRFGEPQEVAELVTWLRSGSCSFRTGAAFDLSGGRATC